MIIAKQVFEDMINSPSRQLQGRVEIYEGSTLALICGCHDNLKDFTIERTGEEGKFFGFGVCQKLTTHFLDPYRQINVSAANNLEVEFGVGSDYIYPCPNFYVHEVTRDENTNDITVIAYDALYKANEHKVSELKLITPYTLRQFAEACASLLGLPITIAVEDDSFELSYATGANFEGTETIREALDAIAEATQTIYFINHDWRLVFKRLDATGEPVAIIDKSKYMTLKSEDPRVLAEIVHATELGDNLAAANGEGVTQYVRDNPFWELREDTPALVDKALATVGGTSIVPFDCTWRGNYLLEIGDKIGFITKDDDTIVSYLIDDKIAFNGGMTGTTKWSYVENNTETATNPVSLGDAIKQTYAKVDKANKEITLVVSQSMANSSAISSLQMTTEEITSTVSSLGQDVADANNNIAAMNTSVSQTAENLQIFVEKVENEGVSQVTTESGFTFNNDGLTVSKSDSELTTTISEDGMVINSNDELMLQVNHQGVDAKNLHATTYLFIGVNSRFQDYNNKTRTGCFWVGN